MKHGSYSIFSLQEEGLGWSTIPKLYKQGRGLSLCLPLSPKGEKNVTKSNGDSAKEIYYQHCTSKFVWEEMLTGVTFEMKNALRLKARGAACKHGTAGKVVSHGDAG